MLTDRVSFYESRTVRFSAELTNLRKRSLHTAIARLTAFTLIALLIFLAIKRSDRLYYAGAALTTILFMILVRYSVNIKEKINLLTKLIDVNRNEISIIQEGKSLFNNGSAFEGQSIHATDLDVFGPGSVFHAINRCSTPNGLAALGAMMNHPYTKAEKILDWQQANDGMNTQTELRQLLTAHALLLQDDKASLTGLDSWVKTPPHVDGKKWVIVLSYIFPLLAVSGLLVYLDSGRLTMLLLSVAANWILLGNFARYIQQQHEQVGKKQDILTQYGFIMKLFSQADSEKSTLMDRLKNTAIAANKEIQGLARLSAMLDQRLNAAVALFLNSFLVFDLHVVAALERWKKRNHAHLERWLDTVGEIELLVSLSTFDFNHPGYAVPVLGEGKPCIVATQLGHPLIRLAEPVTNDFSIGKHEQLFLITGSNMSGKSTFLRTTGIGLLMAQCGLRVCAQEFIFTPMTILSSIRITDSLQENTSFFMAELNRLRLIIDTLETGEPALVLLDEVLRGTNSDDKTFGSAQLISKLLSFHCLSLFATHDLSLAQLEQEKTGQLANYCFESTIAGDELIFDYRLRRGMAVNKNASYLMKKKGIID